MKITLYNYYKKNYYNTILDVEYYHKKELINNIITQKAYIFIKNKLQNKNYISPFKFNEIESNNNWTIPQKRLETLGKDFIVLDAIDFNINNIESDILYLKNNYEILTITNCTIYYDLHNKINSIKLEAI